LLFKFNSQQHSVANKLEKWIVVNLFCATKSVLKIGFNLSINMFVDGSPRLGVVWLDLELEKNIIRRKNT
jgi:hypothetical protein